MSVERVGESVFVCLCVCVCVCVCVERVSEGGCVGRGEVRGRGGGECMRGRVAAESMALVTTKELTWGGRCVE